VNKKSTHHVNSLDTRISCGPVTLWRPHAGTRS